MRAPYCGFFAAFMVLVSPTFAAETSCIGITLPNVLGVGTCLGSAGDLCTDVSEAQNGAASVIGQLVGCVLTGVEDLGAGDQLNIMEQLLNVLGKRIEYGIAELNNILYKLCKTALNVRFNCQTFTNQGKIICSNPLTINLPSALGVGKCETESTNTCANGDFIMTNDLRTLINTVACLVKNLPEQDFQDIINGLTCSLQNFYQKLTGSLGKEGSDFFKSFLKPLLKINCM